MAIDMDPELAALIPRYPLGGCHDCGAGCTEECFVLNKIGDLFLYTEDENIRDKAESVLRAHLADKEAKNSYACYCWLNIIPERVSPETAAALKQYEADPKNVEDIPVAKRSIQEVRADREEMNNR